jgi:predicted RecB family nuclease
VAAWMYSHRGIVLLMERAGGSLQLSASDLVGHLNCQHLTTLDLAVANGMLERPKVWDPLLQPLAERGARHEQGFVELLVSQGFAVTVIDGVGINDDAVAGTRAAMAAGTPIIVQGAFRANRWVGRTDILRRVETPSDLGPWSYEVIDTKLARETKGGTVLQLCLYADLVEAVQGKRPEFGYVVVPWSDYEPLPFRMDDYSAFYRHVRRSLEIFIDTHSDHPPYPEPREHCDICRWQTRCETRRRTDDHLSLVAGMARLQAAEFERRHIATMSSLAGMPLPLAWKPERGSGQAYEKLREQARIQVAGREANRMLFELLPVVDGFGLSMLPVPSPGDVFFDLEGDPFAGEGGLAYLFGYAFTGPDGAVACAADWAFSPAEEKAAFERFVDFILARLEQFPDLHIYHFAPYEPAALKRLMGRYATREEAIDRFLRARVFVDLYRVVRDSLRASTESYSIKKLEALYGFARSINLTDANVALAKVQAGLELGHLGSIDAANRTLVAGYNRDDCLSTAALGDWLEKQRAHLVAQGANIARPVVEDGEASEAVDAWQARINDLVAKLTQDVPPDVLERTPAQHGRWLLAQLLDWHRREEKALWWEHFRLADLAADDLRDERAGLAGLEFIGQVGGSSRSPIHRYRFPPQETELRGDEDLRNCGGAKLGTLHQISIEERWVDIKKRRDSAEVHPRALYAHTIIDTKVLAESLLRLGDHVAAKGSEGDGPYQAARDLLLRFKPRLGGAPLRHEGETVLEAALHIAPMMQGGILPIQGPPGSGKTHTGSRMICALVRAGKSVGITANSHKVIRHLLDCVIEAAGEMGVDVRCIQKVTEAEPDQPRLSFADDSAALLEAIGSTSNIAAGTAWLWARPEAAQSVDVLFIDEAAQMSLANVLAVSQAAQSVVLLGDPQQLDQPMQGSHPEGADVSALQHVLDGRKTIAPDRGLFLEETWRLHPSICRFTSELFYEGRLRPCAGVERQDFIAKGRARGTGLRYLPVPHEGNQSSSPEEADCVRDLVAEILACEPRWIDREGKEHPVTLSDILIVAPYNAQVFELQDRLPGARIGTVDKFQGQQAPVVIYSMTTSSYTDAPRGMEFLYSLNRLNVATSRAQCISILVASPSVFEVQCRTPRQMQLANAFARYLELTEPLNPVVRGKDRFLPEQSLSAPTHPERAV